MNTQTQSSSNKSAQPPVAGAAPTVAAVVTHEVKDFDIWKRQFDAHAPARRAAGIVRFHINRSIDNPNLLSVYLAGTDRSKLEAFFSSDDLRSTMANAGVLGAPTIKLMKPIEDQTNNSAAYGVIIAHKVADFDAWKRVYDEVDGLRRDLGIVGHAVNQSADDPNLVIILHQADKLETLQAFAASDELKAAMKRAGVATPPTFDYCTDGGWGDN